MTLNILKKMDNKSIRVIISGGGTGGHIFPAVSIANALKDSNPENEILFVGAKGKMEMEKVPSAGYPIKGLPIVGIQRQLNIKNIVNDLSAPFKLVYSYFLAKKILREFKPDVAVGVGGYASAPLLFAASSMGIPCLIQEQNGFAGLTNKMLGKRVDKICVAYEGMERFFPKEKITFTGNPIRKEIRRSDAAMKVEACNLYYKDPAKKHIFIVGGSLGSGTLNKAMKKWISDGCPGGDGIEILWQCGKYYKEGIDSFMKGYPDAKNIIWSDFIKRMDLAYAGADLVITRSGASSISEICAAGKAAIFVPSPNVAEDHQTHNAMALVRKGAGLLVKDSEAVENLMKSALDTVRNDLLVKDIEDKAFCMAKLDAAEAIVGEIYKLTRKQ